MESGDSGVTSPVLRVTAEISEIKGNPSGRDGKYSISPSIASKDDKSNLFARKKILHPLYGYNPYQRSNYAGSYISAQNPKNNVSSFTQRVMSAKLLRVKQIQNQLAETQMKLNEALHENKTLRTLQQRQDTVLKKYEGNQEQLPQLLKSHHEEIRILTEKYKQIRANYRELENRMKQKDTELTNLREQYKHLLKLSRDKQLGDREKLTRKVEELEAIIEQQRNKIHSLDKKLALEEKNHRHQLNQEIAKYKKSQSELNSALESISNLKATIEAKDRFPATSASASYPRYQRHPQNTSKPSNLSLPAPPRVSIRQTQRLAQSETMLQQQDDSETGDSFLNYSPGAPGSTSVDSDNSSGNEENPINNKFKLAEVNNESKRTLGLVPGSINISKEAFKQRRERRRSMDKEEKPTKTDEAKKEKVQPRQRKSSKDSGRRLSLQKSKTIEINQSKEDHASNESHDKEDQSKNSIVIDGTKKIEVDIQDANPEEQEYNPGSRIEQEINIDEITNPNDLNIDMDTEFEKYLQSTKLSDEAISEYYRRDFRAEIYELEKKFQDLNKVSDRYIKSTTKMNGTSIHISMADDTDSDDGVCPNGPIQMNDVQDKVVNESNEPDTKTNNPIVEKGNRANGPVLKESQKVDLLKALSNIDKKNKLQDQHLVMDLSEPPPARDFLEETFNVATKPNIPSFPKVRRKSEVMKDLFGSEGTKL